MNTLSFPLFEDTAVCVEDREGEGDDILDLSNHEELSSPFFEDTAGFSEESLILQPCVPLCLKIPLCV